EINRAVRAPAIPSRNLTRRILPARLRIPGACRCAGPSWCTLPRALRLARPLPPIRRSHPARSEPPKRAYSRARGRRAPRGRAARVFAAPLRRQRKVFQTFGRDQPVASVEPGRGMTRPSRSARERAHEVRCAWRALVPEAEAEVDAERRVDEAQMAERL